MLGSSGIDDLPHGGGGPQGSLTAILGPEGQGGELCILRIQGVKDPKTSQPKGLSAKPFEIQRTIQGLTRRMEAASTTSRSGARSWPSGSFPSSNLRPQVTLFLVIFKLFLYLSYHEVKQSVVLFSYAEKSIRIYENFKKFLCPFYKPNSPTQNK